MPDRSLLPGEMNTTTSGLIARLVIRPRPGSPPRVRGGLLFLNPHITWYRKSNPASGYRLAARRDEGQQHQLARSRRGPAAGRSAWRVCPSRQPEPPTHTKRPARAAQFPEEPPKQHPDLYGQITGPWHGILGKRCDVKPIIASGFFWIKYLLI